MQQSEWQSSNLAVDDRVAVRGMDLTGRILMADPDPDSHPHLPGEPVWYLKFNNGTEGGGWKESSLIRLGGKP